jgi:hypothetical protein
MSTALAQRREFSPEFGQRVTVTKTSLAISAELTRDEWENLGEQLGEVGDSTAWWIGDWINAGERNYGEKYTRAEEVTGLDYGTLRNYAHGASRFDLSHRNDKLSFRHHMVVASHDSEAAAIWLGLAAEHGWSVRELQEQIRGEVTKDLGDPARVTLERLTLTVPEDTAERWKHAADDAGLSFQEWCAKTLDEAAA